MHIALSRKHFLHNFNILQSLAGKRTIMAILKSNAYGHGITEMIKLLQETGGCQSVGVANIYEGAKARASGWQHNIFIMATKIENSILHKINTLNAIVYVKALSELKTIVEFTKKNKTVMRVSLECETGMNRNGFTLDNLEEIITILKNNKQYVLPEYIGTHCACIADDALNTHRVINQMSIFQQFCTHIKKEFPNIITHGLASGGVLIKNYCNMIRCGSLLYGLIKSPLLQEIYAKRGLRLKQILTAKAYIVEIKNIAQGEWIGYGNTFKALSPMKIAILDTGYYDGLPLHLSNQYSVMVKNQKALICGRISMNFTTIDISHIDNVHIGDEIVWSNDDNGLSLSDISKLLNVPIASISTMIPHFVTRHIV